MEKNTIEIFLKTWWGRFHWVFPIFSISWNILIYFSSALIIIFRGYFQKRQLAWVVWPDVHSPAAAALLALEKQDAGVSLQSAAALPAVLSLWNSPFSQDLLCPCHFPFSLLTCHLLWLSLLAVSQSGQKCMEQILCLALRVDSVPGSVKLNGQPGDLRTREPRWLGQGAGEICSVWLSGFQMVTCNSHLLLIVLSSFVYIWSLSP